MTKKLLKSDSKYIKNSPGPFSCIRADANAGATCIRSERNSLKNLANMRKMIPQSCLPVFARVRIQAPHVFAQKLIRESANRALVKAIFEALKSL